MRPLYSKIHIRKKINYLNDNNRKKNVSPNPKNEQDAFEQFFRNLLKQNFVFANFPKYSLNGRQQLENIVRLYKEMNALFTAIAKIHICKFKLSDK